MNTKGYGLTISDINDSCPSDLKPYEKAYELRREIRDEETYMQGIYTMKALEVVLSHFAAGLAKKRSKEKYFEEPLLSKLKNSGLHGENLSEEELQKQRELFVAKLLTMQANFELNHKDGGA